MRVLLYWILVNDKTLNIKTVIVMRLMNRSLLQSVRVHLFTAHLRNDYEESRWPLSPRVRNVNFTREWNSVGIIGSSSRTNIRIFESSFGQVRYHILEGKCKFEGNFGYLTFMQIVAFCLSKFHCSMVVDVTTLWNHRTLVHNALENSFKSLSQWW